jgi:threonine dehydratase
MESSSVRDAETSDGITPEAIEGAHADVHPTFRGSPQFLSEGLSMRVGQTVIAKVESVNPIGSFKGRGAWLAVKALDDRGTFGSGRGLVAVSSGNFGQAVAYAGRAFGLRVVVFVGGEANDSKVRRLRLLGAEVRDDPPNLYDAYEAAERAAESENLYYLVDEREPLCAVGAGTIAMEVTAAIARGELPELEAAYVPVGGGSLIGGIGTWLRARAAGTRIVGVQASGAPAMTLSWREGRVISTPTVETAADGIASQMVFVERLEILRSVVDEMILVSEEELAEAQSVLRDELGTTVELAAAASWAGVMQEEASGRGATLIVLTGSNIPSERGDGDE